MFHRIFVIVLVLTGFFVVGAWQVSAAGIIRTIDTGQNGSYQVHLSISGKPVIGITERLPSKALLLSCSLPDGQWNISEGDLHLAVLGVPSITYEVTVKEPGELLGNWIDFSDGSTGNLSRVILGPDGRVKEVDAAEEIGPSSRTNTTESTKVPQPTRSGTASSVLSASLIALSCAGTLIRRRRP